MNRRVNKKKISYNFRFWLVKKSLKNIVKKILIDLLTIRNPGRFIPGLFKFYVKPEKYYHL